MQTVVFPSTSTPTPVASTAPQSFRPDINGLRAWAVLAVVLFHFRAFDLSGGFVGVDVFFVISGFLMTGIVDRGLTNGNFSILNFVLARAKRIIPALLVLIAFLLACGYFFLPPLDLKILGAHSAYGLLFLSNIQFWQEAGYFDTTSHEKWLLHTWSLSVEWQFYLVLPIALALGWRMRPARSTLVAVCSLGCVLSLAASVLLSATDMSASFFLLHTRAWEMLAGGLVYFVGKRLQVNRLAGAIAVYAGLGLILLSIVLFSAPTEWPGWRAPVPVCGAMLTPAANRRVLVTRHAVAQWIGDRSYSIYLWHWPVAVALEYARLQYHFIAAIGGVLCSIALGAVSYALVEKPARQFLGQVSVRRAMMAIGMACICVMGVALGVWKMQGLEKRFGKEVQLAAAGAAARNPHHTRCHQRKGSTSPGCVFGSKESKAIVLGDSHAGALMSAVPRAAAIEGKGVQQWTYDACIFLPGMRHIQPKRFGKQSDCFGFNNWVQAELNKLPGDIPVIHIGRYARYAMGANEMPGGAGMPEVYFGDEIPGRTTPAFLRRFSQEIVRSACGLAQSRPVYMVRPIPEMPVDVPRYMARRLALGLDPVVGISMDEYRERNGWVWAAQDEARARCGIQILNPLEYLCDGKRCIASVGGRSLFYDHGHLNDYGNAYLVPMFQQVFRMRKPRVSNP